MLDYVYSDTINVLMGLNKRILDVSGRLSLLAPQPEAIQVLKKAGIHNILRIFDSEADLLKTSEDIILQTTSFKVSDLQAIANNLQPLSEFDQLRSEIGSAFVSQDSNERHTDTPSYHPSQIQVPQQPLQKPVDEYDQSANRQASQSGFSSPNQSRQPSRQQYAPQTPPPIGRSAPYNPNMPMSPGQQPQFQGRQYVAPSPTPQTRFDSSPKIPSRGFVPPEPPMAMPDFSTSKSETQRFQSPPGSVVRPSMINDSIPSEPMSTFDRDSDVGLSQPKKVQKSKFSDRMDSFDSDSDFDEPIRKKSAIPIVIIVILVIAAVGGIAFFGVPQLNIKPIISTPTLTTTPPPIPQPVPQVPVDSTPVAEVKTEVAQPIVSEPVVSEPVKSIPAPVKTTPPKPVAKPRPRITTPKPVVRQTAPPAVSNLVVITSIPTGASVEINGDILGTTPFAWNKPVFGLVNVTMRKSGYEEKSFSFEYVGGSTRESVTLDRSVDVVPEYQPPVVTRQEPEPAPEPAPVRVPVPEIPPPVAEPQPFIPPPVSTPPVSSVGGDASIFIASIPPVADVYLDGKLVGKTNVAELKLPAGTHILKFVRGTKEVTKEITVISGKNPSQMVRLP